MVLQVKLWAHQVAVWERSGQCMERIEEHKRRVREFMKKIKAEKGKGKELVEEVVATVGRKEGEAGMETRGQSEADTQMDALNAQLEAAGLESEPRTTEPTKKPKIERKEWKEQEARSDFDEDDMQMNALNAQLEAAGFKPEPRGAKSKKPSRSSNFETRDYNRGDRKVNTRAEYHPRSRPNFEPRSRPHFESRSKPNFEPKPRPKRTPSPKLQPQPKHHKEEQRPNRREEPRERPHDNGAMLAGKGKRSRSIGLDIARVFGSEEPGSRATRTKVTRRPKQYPGGAGGLFDDSEKSPPPAHS
ncbi:hypothetical protein TWF281_008184 [Arthrobotrys megalospora]